MKLLIKIRSNLARNHAMAMERLTLPARLEMATAANLTDTNITVTRITSTEARPAMATSKPSSAKPTVEATGKSNHYDVATVTALATAKGVVILTATEASKATKQVQYAAATAVTVRATVAAIVAMATCEQEGFQPAYYNSLP